MTIRKDIKAIIPLILGIISALLIFLPDILGLGIMHQTENIIWTALMFITAIAGIAYGVNLFKGEFTLIGKIFTITGIMFCLIVFGLEVALMEFLLTGGG
ncbi:MAG: hypothetical protein GWO08_18985 [Gammaproteobacteria bacterium]|nr:hypothetical protein [Gammaproteobacteria bacterium]NIN62362.1 hypothetical protein [Gammaproteobacteria bacterium]NIO61416.1 hypothetical protein [Gammaproteobacteria bacterium]NIP49869.1 hypothetical protein [Gammaproteobacteria bacterium]NIQ11902.1 hypothetical protein [Gammaproteobacteria bacterium]